MACAALPLLVVLLVAIQALAAVGSEIQLEGEQDAVVHPQLQALKQQPSTPPRFVPAEMPPEFALNEFSSLPTYSFIGSSSGPMRSSQLAAYAPPGDCKTLGELLAAIPEASRWMEMIKRAGLESILLTDRNVKATLLVPINSAFNAGIDAQPLRVKTKIGELINNDGTLQTAMIGYATLRGLWPASTLQQGVRLPSFATLNKVDPLKIEVLGSPKELLQLQGIGSSSKVLRSDFAACGPSVVHLVDQVLLPFRFDQQPTDAISGTQLKA